MRIFSSSVMCAMAVVVLASSVETHAGKKKPEEPKRITGVEVVLRISVEELDPFNPGDSFIECVVRNKSDQEITAPTKLVGGHGPSLDLWAEGSLIRFGGLHLVYWAGPKKEETAKVKPGAEVVAF